MKKAIIFSVFVTIINFVFGQQLQPSFIIPDSKEQIKEIPDWFLNPAQGEYVGVSFPLKNSELAKKQAVYTALLSYMLQNDVEMALESVVNRYFKEGEVGTNSNFETSAEQISQFSFSHFPSEYEIVKLGKNKYNETFVSIKVLSNATNIYRLNVDVYKLDTEVDKKEKVIEKIVFSLPREDFYMSFLNIYENEKTKLEMIIQDKANKDVYKYDEKKNFQYTIGNTKENKNINAEGEAHLLPDARSNKYYYSTRSSYEMKYSIAIAYITSLLNAVIKTETLINSRIKSYEPIITNDGDKKTYEHNIEEVVKSNWHNAFSQMKIIVNNNNLYILTAVSKENLLNFKKTEVSKEEQIRQDYDRKKFEEIFNEELEKLKNQE